MLCRKCKDLQKPYLMVILTRHVARPITERHLIGFVVCILSNAESYRFLDVELSMQLCYITNENKFLTFPLISPLLRPRDYLGNIKKVKWPIDTQLAR